MSDDQKVYEFKGEKVDVTWDGRLCIHVSECTRAEGELFESGRNPWCKPDVADLDRIATVVERCPTGALSVSRSEESHAEAAPSHNTIVVSNQGPLYFRGDLEIDGAPDDAPGLQFRAALCRCGKSKNKPFCDNSHVEAGFADPGIAMDHRIGPQKEESDGILDIRFAADGPAIADGPLTVLPATGDPATGGRAALCRCGASSNKPYCDGSHKSSGFRG